jgi:hypothetical protein
VTHLSLDDWFTILAWSYLLWPLTMAKRISQYWYWLGNRPDYPRDPQGRVIDPHNPYADFWQLRWFPWLKRYLPEKSTAGGQSLPGGYIPEYGHHDPTTEQTRQIFHRVMSPLIVWAAFGALLLGSRNVPEGRWVALELAHVAAFGVIWFIHWGSNNIASSRLLSRPRHYIITGIIRDAFPHPHPEPQVTLRPLVEPSLRQRP